MKSFQTIAVISYVAGASSSRCYAPSSDAWNAKSCSICVHQEGNQCVVGQQWYDCASSLESCCSTDAMRVAWNEDKDYVELCEVASVRGTPQPTPSPVPTVWGDCINAVSMRYPITTNRECMNACETVAGHTQYSSLFKNGSCKIQSYTIVNGHADVSESSCFNNWIYGYSQEAAAAAMNGMYERTNSPAQCQALCQDDNECVNWIWFTELVRDTTYDFDYVGACALKNKTQVEQAVAQKTTAGTVVGNDFKYCDQGMPHQCNEGGFDCLKCSGIKRCVWNSANHVAGYKDCSHHDECNACHDLPTTKPVTTKPATTKPVTTKPTTRPETRTTTCAKPTKIATTTPKPTTRPETKATLRTTTCAKPTKIATTTPKPTTRPETKATLRTTTCAKPTKIATTTPKPTTRPETKATLRTTTCAKPTKIATTTTTPKPTTRPETTLLTTTCTKTIKTETTRLTTGTTTKPETTTETLRTTTEDITWPSTIPTTTAGIRQPTVRTTTATTTATFTTA